MTNMSVTHTQTLFAHETLAGGANKTKSLDACRLEYSLDPPVKILPYGSTLHYLGCGCPFEWKSGERVADLVDLLVGRCYELYQHKLLTPNRPLRVAYMLPHHNITGGMKCLVEHVKLLKERGHYTIAVHRSDTAERAMPPWTTESADEDIVCNLHQRLADVYPVQNIDVVVVGIFHQVGRTTIFCSSCHACSLYSHQGLPCQVVPAL